MCIDLSMSDHMTCAQTAFCMDVYAGKIIGDIQTDQDTSDNTQIEVLLERPAETTFSMTLV